MRTTSLVRLAGWVAAAGLAWLLSFPSAVAQRQTLAVGPGKTLSCRALSASTVCTLGSKGKQSRRLVLRRDATVQRGAVPTLKLIGTRADGFVMVDSYASASAGLGMCQAGTESFLRVFSLRASGPVQTFETKLESCRENVELALDGVRWDAATGTAHIHWLSAPKSGVELQKTLLVRNGDVEEK